MKILVTGAAGFIGSNLCEELLLRGHVVAGIDNFNPFYPVKIKQSNIEGFIQNEKFALYEGDIRDATFLSVTFNEFNPEAVVHLAAMAGVRPSLQYPELYIDVNVKGTLQVLECAKKVACKNIIFASSSSVYGSREKEGFQKDGRNKESFNSEQAPFKETDNTSAPLSPYAASKKSAELLCHTYHHLYKMSIACLRFFTVYGRRQRTDLAINTFVRKIDNGQKIKIFGKGDTKRDYTYIDDIIQGIMSSIDFVVNNKTPVYDIFNLGESKMVQLSYLVELIERHLDKKAIISYENEQLGDVPYTNADISYSSKIIGYKPNISIEDGIPEFIKWYREHKNIFEGVD